MRYWHPAETSPTGENDSKNSLRDSASSHRTSGSISSDFNPMHLLVGESGHPELVFCSLQKPLGVCDGGPIKLSERFESFGTLPSLTSNPGSRHSSVSRSRHSSPSKSRNSSRQRGRNPSAPRSRRGSRTKMWSAEELAQVPPHPPQMRQRQPDVEVPEIQSFVVPLSDIVVVDIYAPDPSSNALFRNNDRMNVTTMNNGYYEFYFQTQMSYDILLAFLRANLAAERITDGAGNNTSIDNGYIQPQLSRCCSGELFDAETLTARRMKERVQTESISEKLRRKAAHVATRIGECEFHTVCKGC